MNRYKNPGQTFTKSHDTTGDTSLTHFRVYYTRNYSDMSQTKAIFIKTSWAKPRESLPLKKTSVFLPLTRICLNSGSERFLEAILDTRGTQQMQLISTGSHLVQRDS